MKNAAVGLGRFRETALGHVLIHPQAVVDDDCKIGIGTRVWQFASVIRGAIIGKDCIIGGCSAVDGATVGHRVAIGHGAQVHPGTNINDDCFIGPGAIICNDMWPSVDKSFWALPARGQYTVVVEDGAVICAGAIILPGVRIGKGALIAAGAVLERDLAPGCVFMRNGYTRGHRPANWRERRMRFVK